MSRPSMDFVLLHMAAAMSDRSTCPYKHVGAVISREGRILSSGYNGAPAGLPHCVHGPRLPDVAVIPCKNAVHAETNAIAWAARFGVTLKDSEMHTTMSPCFACAQLILQAGIMRVVCGEVYRDTAGVDLLEAGGVEVNLSALL